MIKRLMASAALVTVGLVACGGGSDSSGSSFPFGTAPYAIQQSNFNCAAYLNSISDLPEVNIAWLWNTFGANTGCLDTVIRDGRFNSYQLHLINGVCLRNGNCGSYEVFAGLTVGQAESLVLARDPGLLGKITQSASEAANFLSSRGILGNSCFISPVLETDLSTEASSVIIDTVKPLFPGCTFVHNPVNPTPRIEGTLYEHHSENSVVGSSCIYNNDGFSVSVGGDTSGFPRFLSEVQVADQLKNNTTCELAFIWHHSYNCINGGFVDPRARSCSEVDDWPFLTAILLGL